MVPQFLPPADFSARLNMVCPDICCLVIKGTETRIGTSASSLDKEIIIWMLKQVGWIVL